MDDGKMRPKKGLEGVIFDTSSISKVVPEQKALFYRGYPVHLLADLCSFEEVAYLLWNEDLPTSSELEQFCQKERSLRDISDELIALIRLYPKGIHPMDALRTAISFLGLEDEKAWENTAEDLQRKAFELLAKIPTIIAANYRVQKGLEPLAPRADLNFSENVFHMFFDEVPAPEAVKAFDASLTLYAEHGFNVSTFTARVVISSLSDVYGAITAAVASLKGSLHGGANEQVMYMLQEVGDASKAEAWLQDALAQKKKIMGFGHRVYRHGDSRVPTMKKYRNELAKVKGNTELVELSDILEEGMIAAKNIYPNLDYPAGPAYYLMGFDIDVFTPLFVMARITGWTAHLMEQLADNRLVRPLSDYNGAAEREPKPITER
ncbi:bifunctional 2-methylcitrate synthase/citrate synthase [Oligoflexia bacterium]|nr:bifunctional 2-methylcitrate synthase/citrate synthase [Oligoflexia bacterium]